MPTREARLAIMEHDARVKALAERRTARRLLTLYNRAHDELMRRLHAAIRGGRGDTFGAHQMRVFVAQVRLGQAQLGRAMAGELLAGSQEAATEALRGLSRTISRLELRFRGAAVALPTEEPARFAGILDKRRSSLLRLHQSSMANYGARVVGKVEQELALSLITGETSEAAAARVSDVVGGEFWQAERIARTETAWAYNAGHRDGIEAAAEVVPGLMMRWSEHVSNDGEPLDDRVAVDSMAMHGQVAQPGFGFVCPPESPDGKPVPKGLAGKVFEFPPNRPNDRAVLQPWRAGWGIPGWRWVGGKRAPL